MAETDILNPVQGWWDVLGDNPNPNYGWTRRTATNKQAAKPRFGSWPTRETANAGHTYELLYTDRPWATVLRLKRFYEQFQYGFFTLIDYDANGRHHVGRFTSPPYSVETANGKYTVQGLVFEEIPRARMLVYPNDWDNSTHWIHTVDDFFNSLVSFSGSWIQEVDPRLNQATGSTGSTTLPVVATLQLNHTTIPSDGLLIVSLMWAANPAPSASIGLTITNAPGIAQPSIALSNGIWSQIFWGVLPVGTNQITVTYPGDTNYPAFSLSASFTVVPLKAFLGGAYGPGTQVTTSGATTLSGTAVNIAPADNIPANYELLNPMPAVGDWAQVEYVGWGVRLYFRLSAALGVCDLYFDGVRVVQSLDLSTGTAAATSADISSSEDGGSTVVTMQNVPLDKHRVKVVALAQVGASGATAIHGTAVIFPRIEVMH